MLKYPFDGPFTALKCPLQMAPCPFENLGRTLSNAFLTINLTPTHPFVTLHNARPCPPYRYVTPTQLRPPPPPVDDILCQVQYPGGVVPGCLGSAWECASKIILAANAVSWTTRLNKSHIHCFDGLLKILGLIVVML